jgi:3-hydroxyisobutyrate dehydrogenase-like beta-hydroxyacid dehydrogenase
MTDHTLPRQAAGREQIGFAGLGDIGLPMAKRLLEAGVPLNVYNRTRSKAVSLVALGAIVHDSPASLSAACDVIVTCLHGPDADRDVYLGEASLLSADPAGTLFVNTSTIGPDVARELDAACGRAGGTYLDCVLMGRGREAAAAGCLVIPVAGSAAALERARPTLELLADVIERVGDVGAAQVVKLSYNLHFAISAAGMPEVLQMALAGGADPAALSRMMTEAATRTQPLARYVAGMLARDYHPRGTLRTLAKDVDLGVAFASMLDIPTPFGTATKALFDRAVELGYEGLDVPALMEASLAR